MESLEMIEGAIIGKWLYQNGKKVIEFKANGVAVFGFKEDVYSITRYENFVSIAIPLISSVWLFHGVNGDDIIMESLEPGQRVGTGIRYILKRVK